MLSSLIKFRQKFISDRFYITTTLPYVNSDPHVGHALEFTQADIIARYQQLKGDRVFFNTGTDEHGIKIYNKAKDAGLEPFVYATKYADRFKSLLRELNISQHNFIRTTDDFHKKAAQEFWLACFRKGDIYKKEYKVKYCVGCELEKTDSELDHGRCYLHPNLSIEIIEEENYFFRFSKYQDKLLKLYAARPDFVLSKQRLHEIKNFVAGGLRDFSVSRLKNKMPWGIPVPNDPDHVMYVWFDALVNYVSAIGWPQNMTKFRKWWPVVQVAGKDNLRQQAAMWQAMLMSAGLEPSRKILIHGFINSGGQKMSKSLGNVIDPFLVINKYGVDPFRYYLAREISTFEDGDFTFERMNEVYQSDLANGIGNTFFRILSMTEKYNNGLVPEAAAALAGSFFISEAGQKHSLFWRDYHEAMENFKLDGVLARVQTNVIGFLDRIISLNKPWEMVKAGKKVAVNTLLYNGLESYRQVARALYPFMPATAEKIYSALGVSLRAELKQSSVKGEKWGGLKAGTKINKGEMLFPGREEGSK